MTTKTDDLLALNCFTEIDKHFARFMGEISNDNNFEIILASLIVSALTGKGHICADLPAIAGMDLYDVLDEEIDVDCKISIPSAEAWIDKLRECAVVGQPNESRPLVLDDKGRLYLYRYWEYEHLLAENIKARIIEESQNVDIDLLAEGISRLFPNPEDNKKTKIKNETDWQRIAAVASVMKRFCVISGGPGTGKTTTIAKILILLLEQYACFGYNAEIALAAPTGKASARLKDSIKNMLNDLDCSNSIKQRIPLETFTIHRLLKPEHGSPYFKYNLSNQLHYDIVVVDESSMADLGLMTKLFMAVPLKSHLILLGDRDQLSSVEAGAVLGDICDTGNEHGYSEDLIQRLNTAGLEDIREMNISANEPPIADSIMILRRSHRFKFDSGIAALSRAVRNGAANEAIKLLKDDDLNDISLVDVTSNFSLIPALKDRAVQGYKQYLKAESPIEAIRIFFNFTILCALRKGPYGVENINRLVERILIEDGLIDPAEKLYKGRPVMITRNDYYNKLFNGDVGVLFPDSYNDNKLRFFLNSSDEIVRTILPLKLPEHETVYAMTVHKSQGSEFDSLILILPDVPNPVITRELLYTAITRARIRVEIWGDEKILRHAIDNPIRRKSGLRDYLWSDQLIK